MKNLNELLNPFWLKKMGEKCLIVYIDVAELHTHTQSMV